MGKSINKIGTKFKEAEIRLISEAQSCLKLGDLVEKVIDNRGKTPPIARGGYELLEVNSIKAGSRTPGYEAVEKFVSEETYNNWFRSGTIQEYDIIIPTVGSIGNVAISLQNRGATAQNLICLRLKKTICSPMFIYYYLSSPYFKETLLNLDIGGVQPSIKVPHLLNLEISIPDLSEQKQIAKIISSLDDKIELNRQINANLEKVASALFKRWFVDFEFPDENGKPYKSSGGKMIGSELGLIPEGWMVKKLTDIADFQNGFAFYKIGYSNSGMKVVDLLNIDEQGNFKESERDKFVSEDVCSNQKYQKFLLRKDDLVMVMTDMTQKMGILGKCARINKDDKYILNQRIGRIRVFHDINVNFLQSYLNSNFQLEKLKSKALGTVQKYVNTSHVQETEFIIPTEEIMNRFARFVNPLYSQIEANNEQINNLALIKGVLLPRLMNGKIRVKT